ncbi:FdhF/YdeP family oxidoreductase [Rhodococcus sp. BP-252]|uniref:FdhF/YdeP family oxidoreductase n=1 Tax=unclassified Rhodococcus (in: high G+C Gram-positive bacteria) TaxID=192944 RepID=UPI00142FD810|nr:MULTISPECIES: FdhF/YdeP family oxidoreductase [unclassified Rhodococcus (in: high G+C Gram-positive bacteria)]MBY6410813.1 FdhF/YdeP family oxidoreductase [Rhodococcus sp. BP-320]MBY6415362.1 FdhF/YdeP family oxidoreductase [Rhodococcus sp. BP-321]MBY6419977.1 FdhF/YdeP family oxidoreductase [Rhodococcus sp. BP-324]MBY6425369.1 FdhF/YdeP family oxidoreductase [Rhodococcus sp. BP-323]MBY6430568.1 FdhF/YdeP family oxidoreductase [Rhodococcus sp. BP-322]
MRAGKHDVRDYDEADLDIEKPKTHAAGATAVAVSMKRALGHMGPVRTAKTLLDLNQAEGFDCMSCAWPDPDPGHRHVAEFCENGAKAVAEEGTTTRATPDFFAAHSIADLDSRSEHWLGQQGRITHPMVKLPGARYYEPIEWDDAFRLIGDQLKSLADPTEAIFYTSGRASNESAFVYQLFARAFGTNNLPDCSNMCHESTSIALQESIGIGKASVTLEDVYAAELIVIAGQNPGTNHPRMLSALEKAKQNGAKILSINPLREAGLVNFKNPQTPRGMVGPGTDISDMHLPIKVNGDLALFQAFGSLLVEWDCIDRDFIDRHTNGYEEWKAHVTAVDWDVVTSSTGLTREQITDAAKMLRDSKATVFCWAMGLTQHRNAVATIKEVTNLAFAQGNIGKKGAGLFPVRGHSNVQGDRTMGIWERVPQHFLDSIQKEFGFDPPREHGHDTVDSIRAMRDGKAQFFLGLGGNFVQATPDTDVTAQAMRNLAMTVHISTKINRSHLVTGDTALILPTLGRTEKDVQATGPQWISVEDSTCSVHSSRGPLKPASEHLRSEVAILTGIAEAAIGDRYGIDWKGMRDDYRLIREHISRVVPGCAGYEVNVRRPGGFILPHPPRDSRTFETESGKGEFVASPIEVLHVPDGHLLLQTLRSHDQFNTTIYGLSDRYRGIEGGRRVVFLHRDDIAALGFQDGDFVDLVTRWEDDDIERCASNFRIVEYDTPRGCAAAYYPETNPLVPLDSTAMESNCPTSKSVVIQVVRAGTACEPVGHGHQDDTGSDWSHKTHPQPHHLS